MNNSISPKNPHAVALGRLGGSRITPAKAAAVRRNGALGGRPRKPGTPAAPRIGDRYRRNDTVCVVTAVGPVDVTLRTTVAGDSAGTERMGLNAFRELASATLAMGGRVDNIKL